MAFCCCVAPEKEEDDRERAVKEVAEVYERIKIQQPLLLLHCSSSHQHQHLAQTLLGEALRALNVALSIMTTTASPAAPATSSVVVKAEPHQDSPPAGSGDPPAQTATIRSGSNKKRRRSITMEAAASWAGLTTVPYDDGYEWRKYGEKKINGTNYTRSYFRCTYKDDTGCLATKYVQQKDSSDPPVFQVTYNNKHTCSNNNAAAAAAAMVNNTIKQEQPVLPPLVEACALPFDDQTLPCQQQAPSSFPISMHQQLFSARDCCHGGGDIPSTSSSSSFSGGESCSCDEFYSPGRGIHMDNMVQQMPAAEASPAPADDDLSFYDYDLDLFLLCDSFKDY